MAPSGVFAGWHCSTSPTGAVEVEEEEEKPTTNRDAGLQFWRLYNFRQEEILT